MPVMAMMPVSRTRERRDAVGGEVVVDAEGGNPEPVGDGEHLAGAVVEEGGESDGEAGDGGKRGRGSALRLRRI